MGNEIIKYDEDKYLLWNTTVDSFEAWDYSYDQMFKYLMWRNEHAPEFALTEVTERMERTKDRGYSRLYGEPLNPKTVFIFEQRGFLYFEDVPAFLDSYDETKPYDERFDLSLLHPFEDS